jgi:hypothetical protein
MRTRVVIAASSDCVTCSFLAPFPYTSIKPKGAVGSSTCANFWRKNAAESVARV